MSNLKLFIVVDPRDNVATAIADIQAGQSVTVGSNTFSITRDIAYGHKFALADLAAGDYVVKYGADIGRATAAIGRGSHVHVHNVEDIVDEVRKC